MANYCRKCGNVLLEDSQFCEYCGTRVGAQAQPQSDPFANTQGGYYPQQPTYTNQGSNRPSVKGRVFGIVSFASSIFGVVYIFILSLMLFAMGAATNSFFLPVIIMWFVIGIVIEGVALGFGIAADKNGNDSQICKVGRILTIVGFALLATVIIVFIIVASTASNEAQRVQSVIDSFRNDDILSDWYDYY